MRKQKFCLVFAMAVLMLASAAAVAQTSRSSVSASEVNGTFKMNFTGKFKKFSNEIKILALGNIKVTQNGSDANCGFGHNVYATGTHTKISSKKPTFDSQEP